MQGADSIVALLSEYTDLGGQVRAVVATMLRNNNECAYRPSGLSEELIVAFRSGNSPCWLTQIPSDEEQGKYLAAAVEMFLYGDHLGRGPAAGEVG